MSETEGPATSGLGAMLSDADLALIRDLFDNATMVEAGLAAVSGSYPRALPWNQVIMDQFYREDGPPDPGDPRSRMLPRADIERVVIGILAAKRERWALAVHMYWGLCVAEDPLTPDEIAEILLLTATYAGADVISEGTAVLAAVLTTLSELATKARAEDDRSKQVAIAGTHAVVGVIMGKLFPLVG